MKKSTAAFLCVVVLIVLVGTAKGQTLSGNVGKNARRDARSEAAYNNSFWANGLRNMMIDVKSYEDLSSVPKRLRTDAKSRIYRNTATDVPVFSNLTTLKLAVIKSVKGDNDGMYRMAESRSINFVRNRIDIEVEEVGSVEVEGRFYAVALVRLIDSDEFACVFADWVYQE